jgi:hypothetical protein
LKKIEMIKEIEKIRILVYAQAHEDLPSGETDCIPHWAMNRAPIQSITNLESQNGIVYLKNRRVQFKVYQTTTIHPMDLVSWTAGEH